MQARNMDSAVSSGPIFLNQNETMPVDACVVRFVDGDSISPASIVQSKNSAFPLGNAEFLFFKGTVFRCQLSGLALKLHGVLHGVSS